MKDLAPHIYRQRMTLEGIYGDDFEPSYDGLQTYLFRLSGLLRMTVIYGPVVMREAEKKYPKHKGFEAVMVWAESGVNVYTWEDGKFFTVDVYSCKPFSVDTVRLCTQEMFKATQLYYRNYK